MVLPSFTNHSLLALVTARWTSKTAMMMIAVKTISAMATKASMTKLIAILSQQKIIAPISDDDSSSNSGYEDADDSSDGDSSIEEDGLDGKTYPMVDAGGCPKEKEPLVMR